MSVDLIQSIAIGIVGINTILNAIAIMRNSRRISKLERREDTT